MPTIEEASQKFLVSLLLDSRGNFSSAIIEVIDRIVSRFLQGASFHLSAEQSERRLEASSSILSTMVPCDLNHFHNGENRSNGDRIDPVAPRSLMEDGSSALAQEPEDKDLKLDSEERSSMEILPFPSFIKECLSAKEREICDDIYKNR